MATGWLGASRGADGLALIDREAKGVYRPKIIECDPPGGDRLLLAQGCGPARARKMKGRSLAE